MYLVQVDHAFLMISECTRTRDKLDQLFGGVILLLHEAHPVGHGHGDEYIQSFDKLGVDGDIRYARGRWLNSTQRIHISHPRTWPEFDVKVELLQSLKPTGYLRIYSFM